MLREARLCINECVALCSVSSLLAIETLLGVTRSGFSVCDLWRIDNRKREEDTSYCADNADKAHWETGCQKLLVSSHKSLCHRGRGWKNHSNSWVQALIEYFSGVLLWISRREQSYYKE